MKAFEYPKTADVIPSEANPMVHAEDGRVCYSCPDEVWGEHLEAWRKERRDGNKVAPEPMPERHLLFDIPESYGRIPLGCQDESRKRKAIESTVRGMLHGWDADLTVEQVNSIVNATVNAKMHGLDTGALPFVACLSANL